MKNVLKSGLISLKIPYLPYFLILYQIIGFSDDLDDFLGFLLGFSIQYSNNNEIKNPKNNPNNILSCMICSICSTLNINIKGIKNPPIRWFYSFAVSSIPKVNQSQSTIPQVMIHHINNIRNGVRCSIIQILLLPSIPLLHLYLYKVI